MKPVVGSWTPDGRRLLYRRGSGRPPDLWYAAPDPDSTPVVIMDTPVGEVNPSLSPDGRWLVYTSDESFRREVYVRPFPGPGGRTQVSIDGGRDPVWAHSGREIFYLDTGDSSRWYLTVATVRTEPSFAVESREQLFSFESYVSGNIDLWWDISPDDQSILALKDPDGVGGAAAGGAGEGRLILVQNFFEELRQRMGN